MKTEKEEQDIKLFNNAQATGVIAVVAICLFFLIANSVISYLKYLEIALISFDYISIIFAYLSVVCFYSFAKFKNIYHFIIGLGFTLVFICTVILYFISLANR